MDDSLEESLLPHLSVNETTSRRRSRRIRRRTTNDNEVISEETAAAGMASDDDDDDVDEDDDDDDVDDDEESLLISQVQRLMDRVTLSADNPSPSVLHALASILETQEARYMEETAHSSSNNNLRASHIIGQLGNLIRDNDEFFHLISSKYLGDSTRFPISVQTSAARLLLSCSLTWTYPHDFEDTVLNQIKAWVMDDNAKVSALEYNRSHHNGNQSFSDSEMLITYATGLLALSLTGGGHLVEDVLTSGLPAKLMRFLRSRVLGETTSSQKDAKCLVDKNMSTAGSKSRDDSRGRFRHILGAAHLADPKVKGDGTLDDQCVQMDQDRSVRIEARDETCWDDGREPPNCSAEEVDINDVDVDGEDKCHDREIGDAKIKLGDTEPSGKEDPSKRRANRGWARSKGKARVSEGAADNEMVLASPGSGSRYVQGRSNKDRNLDMKRLLDAKKSSGRVNADSVIIERGDNDECFQGCIVGSKDFSDLVKKAVRAAEDEARSANAPSEAIKAAGDAAAEVVKSAALEEFRSTGNEEASVLAASRAASTVIDAAIVVEAARSSSVMNVDSINGRATEPADIKEETEEYFIPDTESLAKLREKFCIQCLEILGEYVEVLGPVLHEKGVDVSLALLQRSSKHEEASKDAVLLPDILKLICALAAHRKFAALFVDRGGMQKLLLVPRTSQTFFGLSSCLFTIGSLQGIMERVCALPSEVVQKIVELVLQLLECPQDQARKNAALFFNAAFVFRAILDCFNAQDGLQKLLSLLNEAASVRSGVNLGASVLSGSGSLRNDRSPAEVLTSAEKQIAYHTCVALRQYFRAHLLLLVDSIRPNKNNRSVARNLPSVRAPYKPLDISNEAMDAVFLQLQKDRKLGPAFVRTRWPEVDTFLSSNGHIIMLELCQAPPGERYLHDLLQYALGILHIVTLVPYSRKLIVNATLSNDRVGIAVILDAATCGSYVEPEIIHPALNVLVNLVCPPPSISNKASLLPQVQQSASGQAITGTTTEARDKNAERNISDRAVSLASQSEPRERNVEPNVVDRGYTAVLGTSSNSASSHTSVPPTASGLVGDRRICLGAGTGCAGLAAQLEQGFRQAREAVRSNNGIKVLLHLLQPRVGTPPSVADCLRALACRALLGLARDDTIAHILTKLQVGKKLSELIRDPGSQTHGTEQDRWQAELAQAAIELISIVTNSGRASTLAATDAAIPTLRRIERAAIAAATPITYHSRELLLLVHEHLQASGLATTAATLLKEAQLTPLPSLAAPSSLAPQVAVHESPSLHMQWPCGRSSFDFLSDKSKCIVRDEHSHFRGDLATPSSKKKPLVFSSSLNFLSKNQVQPHDSIQTSNGKGLNSSKNTSTGTNILESPKASMLKPNLETESQLKSPIVSPLKRKLTGLNIGVAPSGKRLHSDEHGFCSPTFPTPNTARKSSLFNDVIGFSTPCTIRDQYGRSIPSSVQADNIDDNKYSNSHVGQMSSFQHGLPNDSLSVGSERLTLDSLVVQYLKHQHRQCPAPISTLPPLSLLNPHVCPEPRRSLDAPSNVTSRLATREFRSKYGGIHGSRRDRQFVYSRFRPWRTCRDDGSALLSCITFLGNSLQIAVGSHSGELKIFDSSSNNLVDSCTSHQSPLTLVQSHLSSERQLVLSSSPHDVRLWDAPGVSAGPIYSFEGCKAARFSNYGTVFAALSSDLSRREILLYDIQTCNLDLKLTDTSSTNTSGKGLGYSFIHFSPSDTMILWNGVLWDRRSSGPIHQFDQFTDYGGGGFHPSGNEVIINSEVWDLRKFRLLRSVPSLDQTAITFNAHGDVIYAILRRNLDDATSAINTRRVKHPLFSAFRTVDAINYSDIATTPVDRCVLDFATEQTDSFIGLVTMDDQEEMFSSARIYEIGRRRPTDDDSDPDDAESEDEEDDDDEDVDEDPLLSLDIDGDSDGDDDDDSVSELEDEDEDDDGDFVTDGVDFGEGTGILEIVTEGDEDDEDDDSQLAESFSSEDEDFVGF